MHCYHQLNPYQVLEKKEFQLRQKTRVERWPVEGPIKYWNPNGTYLWSLVTTFEIRRIKTYLEGEQDLMELVAALVAMVQL